MISYPYIESLFRAVLSKSKTMGGRFFISTRSGTEINTDDLGQVITDTLGVHQPKRYPLVMMLPPTVTGNILYQRTSSTSGQQLRITLFFLETVGYLDNQIVKRNPTTGTSMQGVTDVWEEMMQCATDFVTALDFLQRRRDAPVFVAMFQVTGDAVFQPIAGTVGADRVSGIRVDFPAYFGGYCEELVDYLPANLNAINLSTIGQP